MRLKITAWSRTEALASAMSFMPSQAAMVKMTMNGTQTKAAFCAQIWTVCPAALTIVCGPPAKGP